MITLNDALAAREFWHMTKTNADGTPLRCRRNGATKTWKREPGKFLIPVKHGLKYYFYIDNFDGDLAYANNAHEWCTAEKWPAEHVLFEGLDMRQPTTREQQLEQARKVFAQDPTPAMAAVIRQLERGHA